MHPIVALWWAFVNMATVIVWSAPLCAEGLMNGGGRRIWPIEPDHPSKVPREERAF